MILPAKKFHRLKESSSSATCIKKLVFPACENQLPPAKNVNAILVRAEGKHNSESYLVKIKVHV